MCVWVCVCACACVCASVLVHACVTDKKNNGKVCKACVDLKMGGWQKSMSNTT